MQPRRAGHLVQPRARRPAPHKQGSTPARTCCRRWFADVDQESLSRPSTSTSPPPPQFRLCSTESKTTTYEKENIDYQTYFYARPRGEPKEEIPRSEFCRYTGRNLFQWQRWPLLGLHVIGELRIVAFSASIGLLSGKPHVLLWSRLVEHSSSTREWTSSELVIKKNRDFLLG
ncbi:uncharacterized protein [Lolium perenne]|uniref:uncharacterized protein isoform X1 n=1 Tax=Lolium perenne TaxID=4522 RepID=UPI003A9A4BD0